MAQNLGRYNASTNTPPLTNNMSDVFDGDFYIVSIGGDNNPNNTTLVADQYFIYLDDIWTPGGICTSTDLLDVAVGFGAPTADNVITPIDSLTTALTKINNVASKYKIVPIESDYLVTVEDFINANTYFVIKNSNLTITLPDITNVPSGYSIRIKNYPDVLTNSSNTTINSLNGLFDTLTSITLSAPNLARQIIADESVYLLN